MEEMESGRYSRYYRPITEVFSEETQRYYRDCSVKFENDDRKYIMLTPPHINNLNSALKNFFPDQFHLSLAQSIKDKKSEVIDSDLLDKHMTFFDKFGEHLNIPNIKNNDPKKNRYAPVVPNEQFGLRLIDYPSLERENYSPEYINASNVIPPASMVGLRQTYIAAQAPTPYTINSFWKLVWEQHVEIIVMLTKCNDAGVPKADPYWPLKRRTTTQNTAFLSPPQNKGREKVNNDELGEMGAVLDYGDITVKVRDIDEVLPGVIRRLVTITNIPIVSAIRNGEISYETPFKREIVQIHFTEWPDHGVPEDYDLLFKVFSMYRITRMNMSSPYSPVLCHCSAGIGRTGTFIGIDIMLDHISYNQKLVQLAIASEMKKFQRDLADLKKTNPNSQININSYGVGVNMIGNNNTLLKPKYHHDRNKLSLIHRAIDLSVVFSVVLHLRVCRVGMVQKKAQYGLIYSFIRYCVDHPQRHLLDLI